MSLSLITLTRQHTAAVRINSIDTVKVAAILGVICLHTGPFGDAQYTGSFLRAFAFIINQTARFAVPFFFLVSGFFFGRSLRLGAQPRELFLRYLRRLIVVFLVWSLIYAVAPRDFQDHLTFSALFHSQLDKTVHWIAENPFTFLLQGTRIHLWFLPTLMISLFLLTLFITAHLQRYVIYFAIALYTTHLLIGPYSGTSLGLPYNLNTINTPLTGFLFTIIGWSLAYRQAPPPWFAYLLLIGGFILHNVEAFYLHQHYNSDLSAHHYLIGTVPFAMGVFLICLTYPQLGKNTFFPTLGMLTLGIYVSHFLALDIVSQLKQWISGPLWEFAFPFFVYFLALGITLLLARSRYFKPIVT
jgi:surface polysaccharide O-acyltransferase-like enzyme